jgi:hypothetical protein
MKNEERQINREKEFDKIRKNYAESRKKVIDDFSSRTFSRYCAKDESNNFNDDYSSNHREYAKGYSRSKDIPMHTGMGKYQRGNL